MFTLTSPPCDILLHLIVVHVQRIRFGWRKARMNRILNQLYYSTGCDTMGLCWNGTEKKWEHCYNGNNSFKLILLSAKSSCQYILILPLILVLQCRISIILTIPIGKAKRRSNCGGSKHCRRTITWLAPLPQYSKKM